MKTQATVGLKALSVINSISFLILFMGCKTIGNIENGKSESSDSCYKLLRHKTRTKEGKVIAFRYFDYEKNNRRIPFSFAIINGIAVEDSIVRISSDTQEVDIIISETLKETIKIDDLKITKGDSIIVKLFLRDSNTKFD